MDAETAARLQAEYAERRRAHTQIRRDEFDQRQATYKQEHPELFDEEGNYNRPKTERKE